MQNFVYLLMLDGPWAVIVLECFAAVYLKRRRVARRRLAVLGSYLVLTMVAIVYARLFPDEFGFSWIPALQLIAPWSRLLPNVFAPSAPLIALGAGINCAAFLLLDRFSFPIHRSRSNMNAIREDTRTA